MIALSGYDDGGSRSVDCIGESLPNRDRKGVTMGLQPTKVDEDAARPVAWNQ